MKNCRKVLVQNIAGSERDNLMQRKTHEKEKSRYRVKDQYEFAGRTMLEIKNN